MQAFLGIGRPLAMALTSIAALVLTGDLAAAAERLVMSYDCRVEGRDLAVVQSAPREYPILGTHQQEIHTACSPADPNRCRSWRIHRFDIDCNGARVAWLDVVGAVAYQQRYPARVKGDRMLIGMGRSWGQAGREAYRGTRMRYPDANNPYADRYGTPRAATGRVVELPPGYAPMLGIDARFREAPAQLAAKPTPPMDAETIVPPRPNPARRDSSGEPAATSTRTETASAGVGRVETPTSLGTDDKASPGYKILNPSGEADATASKHLRHPITPAPGTPPASAASPDQVPPATALPVRSVENEDKLAMLPAAPTPAAAPTLPSPAPGEPAPVVASPENRQFTTVAGAAIGVAALAAIALAAFMVSRPRAPRADPVPPEERDYAAISLGGDTGTRALVVKQPGAIEPRLRVLPTSPDIFDASAPAVAETAQSVAADAAGEGVLDWLPETRAEALALLGAAPDAPVEVVKKIADGLRQSWHPDLAHDESDRIVREKRTKQLNIAWGLIAARSQAA